MRPPALPDQVQTQERDGPTVTVLLVNGPLRAEEMDDGQPKCGEGEREKQGAGSQLRR